MKRLQTPDKDEAKETAAVAWRQANIASSGECCLSYVLQDTRHTLYAIRTSNTDRFCVNQGFSTFSDLGSHPPFHVELAGRNEQFTETRGTNTDRMPVCR